MAEDKILTKHPNGKTGRNITTHKYDTLKQAILSALSQGPLTHNELFGRLDTLVKHFEGNVGWYGETVKLDLEANGIIRRTAEKPARYYIVQQA